MYRAAEWLLHCALEQENSAGGLSQAFPSGLQPEETGKRGKIEMHQQCRQSSLDWEFIIAQGRTVRLNCGTRVMQRSLHPVLKPSDRSKVLQD